MERIQLQFRCQEDINEMPIEQDGKLYCHRCHHTLKDFRLLSRFDVLNYTTNNKGCGIFLQDHVQEEEKVLFSMLTLRKFIAVTSTFFLAENLQAQPTNSLKEDLSLCDTTPSEKNVDVSIKPIVHRDQEITREDKNHKSKGHRAAFEYGIFYKRKFPYLIFRRKEYRKISTGFWMPSLSNELEKKPRKYGFLLFTIKGN